MTILLYNSRRCRRHHRRQKGKDCSSSKKAPRNGFFSRPEAPLLGFLFVVVVIPIFVRSVVWTANRYAKIHSETTASSSSSCSKHHRLSKTHVCLPKRQKWNGFKFTGNVVPVVVAFPTTYLPTRASFRLQRSESILDYAEQQVTGDDLIEDELPEEQREKIILWRGDKKAGYSMNFRQSELSNAIASVLSGSGDAPLQLNFTDALIYNGSRDISVDQTALFEGAMQYVDTACYNGKKNILPSSLFIKAVQRCSLIREAYEVVAEGETYEELGQIALSNGSFKDIMQGGTHEHATWCVRLRKLGGATEESKERKFGKSVRSSLSSERQALSCMAPLLLKFGGAVQLKDPDCKLVVIEGLNQRKKILARVISKGVKTSVFAPATRICITNTPLCPIASFSMCNIAQIRDKQTVLDPYAGSCATLLAAAKLAPSCKTVGIEISKKINKDDIWKDFTTRSLPLPAAIINGDCTDAAVRDEARNAVGGNAFDVIITDPPYGVREKTGSGKDISPLFQFIAALSHDKINDKPLLKKGGRFVTFVPHTPGEDVMSVLPSREMLRDAGLELVDAREQPLNDVLCRWLVTFECKL